MSYYLGVDVGKNGGFAYFNENGGIENLVVMPKIGKEYDYNSIRACFNLPIKHIVIEDVHALFGVGAGTTFALGLGKGFLIAMAVAFEIPYSLVQPKVWQKEMWDSTAIVKKPTKRKLKNGSFAKKTDTKKTSLIAAKRLFPKETFLATKRSSVPHDGLVDAALMGEYCRRMYK